jgi:3-phenylpropionate/trans-cinnamate dioxygenase ferredoxin reductase subunit
MRRVPRVTVIGAGQAAARSISAMRNAGFDGGITLVGEEPHLPYERPPLSKEALFGDAEAAPAILFDERFYLENKVDLELGRRVESFDATTGEVRLGDGARLESDRILIATGSRARQAFLPGVEPERILSLRSYDDVKRLRPLLAAGPRLVLIGGGFIGLEIAAGAVRQGCTVTVIEARPRLIERAISSQVSAQLQRLHTRHGVTIKLDCMIVRARQGSAQTELSLSDGSTVIADVIVAGVGALPNAELAVEAGIACSNGIDVDAHCKTQAERVWAAGDVASRVHPWWQARIRLESWESAEHQAALAGRSIAAACKGDQAPEVGLEPPPWFWSDQYGMNLQILGCVTDSDRTICRPGADGSSNVLFHFRGKQLRGAELVCAGKERPLIRKLLQAGWNFPAERLGDMGASLKELLAASTAATAV